MPPRCSVLLALLGQRLRLPQSQSLHVTEPRAPPELLLGPARARGVDRALVTKRPGCDAYPAGVRRSMMQPRLRDPWDVRIRFAQPHNLRRLPHTAWLMCPADVYRMPDISLWVCAVVEA